MTETPIYLPAGLRWIKLVCRLGRLVTDSTADENAYPDLIPVGGTLTLAASPSRVRIQEADGRWRSVEVTGRMYTIRADGELIDNEDRVGVYIPDPTSPLIEPQNYTITAAVKPTTGAGWNVTISGSDILPDVVDLVAVSSVGAVSPSVTASFDARLYALEQGGGGGTSSGIELVSGTVPLNSSSAPVREFYCTSATTINGVSFPAGTAVVFRRTIDGQWGYITVDGWTATGSIPDPDPELITVTATAPNWADDTTNGGGTWTTPTITGVTYSPASGTASPGQTVTVTATAQSGYTLTGTSSWQHTFPVAPTPTITLADEIMSLTPVGYWKLDEPAGSTTFADSSGNNRHGTGATKGVLDGFADLDTSSHGITIADHDDWSLAGATGFTVFALVKPRVGFTTHREIVGKRNSNQIEWSLYGTKDTAKLTAGAWALDASSSPLQNVTDTAIANLNVWQGLAAAVTVADGESWSIYKNNGVPDATTAGGSGSVSGLGNGTSPLRIGFRGDGTINFLRGGIGHVAIFRTKLSSAQIGALMDAARGEGLIP